MITSFLKFNLVVSCFLLLLPVPPAIGLELILYNTPTYVCFSPDSDCASAIVAEIVGARSEILVQAYSFSSAPIAKALASAFKRGVRVTAIMDISQGKDRSTAATFISKTGIPTLIDTAHTNAQDKIMVIDRETVITGSFNFTKKAEKNKGNLLILKNPELALIYLKNWEQHGDHAKAY